MARSTYTGGTVTERINVEHLWGTMERRVAVDIARVDGHPMPRLAMPADVMRELGQALIGAADEFEPSIDPDDDVTEPDQTPEPAPEELTGADRRLLAALSPTEARTPAELKRILPGAMPVANIRGWLQRLQAKGYARPAPEMAAGNVTPWVAVKPHTVEVTR